jgi:hypothetical protein
VVSKVIADSLRLSDGTQISADVLLDAVGVKLGALRRDFGSEIDTLKAEIAALRAAQTGDFKEAAE